MYSPKQYQAWQDGFVERAGHRRYWHDNGFLFWGALIVTAPFVLAWCFAGAVLFKLTGRNITRQKW